MSESKAKLIRIVSPGGLSEEKALEIAAAFADHFNYENDSLELVRETDTDLLGGFIVYFEDRRYDYSAKGRLDYLSELLRRDLEFTEDGKISIESSLPHEKDDDDVYIDEVGEVIAVADGIAYVKGLGNCLNSEHLIFTPECSGIAMNLERDRIGVILLGKTEQVQDGSICKRSGKAISVPVGDGMLGRVVNAMGVAIDDDGAIAAIAWRPIESEAASVIERKPVSRPLYTGITAIDAMTPIGRGQRELIIGDRQSGKTAIAIDTILNQADQNVICVYVAIGQKLSTLAAVVETLRNHGAMRYTTIVAAGAADEASMQYIAPFSATAIAEYWMREAHKDVLIIYDDLTKNAQAYRNLSLLLRRPPGREAYPGDVFYLHSRLLERAAQLSDDLGGGSLTALPIVETQSGDISAYIPTNIISITDGQIYLETDLFYSGQRPAINVGLSVSRVGGAAQVKAMKQVASALRIHLAQYNEIAAFSQFGSELDDETHRQLARGKSLMEIIKQDQYDPRRMAVSVVLLFLSTEGFFADRLGETDIAVFAKALIRFLAAVHWDVLKRIQDSGQFTDDDKEEIRQLSRAYLPQWQQEQVVESSSDRKAQR